MTDTELAKIAYRAYGKAVNFKNYQGKTMPAWSELGEKIQNAWTAAVGAVIDQLVENADGDVSATD